MDSIIQNFLASPSTPSLQLPFLARSKLIISLMLTARGVVERNGVSISVLCDLLCLFLFYIIVVQRQNRHTFVVSRSFNGGVTCLGSEATEKVLPLC